MSDIKTKQTKKKANFPNSSPLTPALLRHPEKFQFLKIPIKKIPIKKGIKVLKSAILRKKMSKKKSGKIWVWRGKNLEFFWAMKVIF